MSKNYNDCDIVLELLPLYLDGQTCEESNTFVKEHLAGCAECREVHELMSAELSQDRVAVSDSAVSKRKRKWRQLPPTTKRRIIVIVGVLGYLCLMVGCVALAIWLLVFS